VLAALILLILLIQAKPALLFADGTFSYGVVALVVAVALGIISTGIRPGEAGHLVKVVRPGLLLLDQLDFGPALADALPRLVPSRLGECSPWI
jgi:hypothetical protein